MPTISKIQSFGLPVGSVIQTQTDFDADAVLHTNTDSSQPETILSASINISLILSFGTLLII